MDCYEYDNIPVDKDVSPDNLRYFYATDSEGTELDGTHTERVNFGGYSGWEDEGIRV